MAAGGAREPSAARKSLRPALATTGKSKRSEAMQARLAHVPRCQLLYHSLNSAQSCVRGGPDGTLNVGFWQHRIWGVSRLTSLLVCVGLTSMAGSWQDYQEEVARFFRDLGLEAVTDFTVPGVRTTHDVDVFVKSHHVGFDVVWIVECKHWARSVTKLHVLALREIVTDVGADRGILLSEAGFDNGTSFNETKPRRRRIRPLGRSTCGFSPQIFSLPASLFLSPWRTTLHLGPCSRLGVA